MKEKRILRVRFLGAMGCVTGSATLLECITEEFTLRYLIDLGLIQNDPVFASDEDIRTLASKLDGIFYNTCPY